MISLAVSLAAERTVPVLPGLLYGPVSQAAGTAGWLFSAKARAAVQGNLAVIAPERRDHGRLARRVFVEQARHYLETFRILRLDRRRLLEMVEIDGWAHLAQAHARGRGVVLASAHLGPVVLCGQIVAAKGLDVSVLVETKSGDIGRIIDRARGHLGIQTIETSAVVGIGRSLRRGGVVGMLADRALGGVGQRVPFFGREALLPSGHIAIALRTGAALVPGFAVRDGHRPRAVILPEIKLRRTGDRDADVRDGVLRWAAVLEPWIRRAPEQWSVFEPIWQR